MALPFTLKPYYLKAKEEIYYGNSNISPCKNIINLREEKSSLKKRGQKKKKKPKSIKIYIINVGRARPINLDIALCNEALLWQGMTILYDVRQQLICRALCRTRGDDDDDGVHELIELCEKKIMNLYPQGSMYEMLNVSLTITFLSEASTILIHLSVRASDDVSSFNSLAEPTRTVGQFHVLIRRQNRPLHFLWQNRPFSALLRRAAHTKGCFFFFGRV